MARQRTLKPGFFSNEELAACPALTRLFFEGLWCWADREGRLEDRPRRLKAEILPYDEADGEAMVAELAARGFLVRYEAAGLRLLQIVNFAKHQSPHPREVPSVLPGQDEVMPGTDQGTTQDKPSSGKARKSRGRALEEQRTSPAGISGISRSGEKQLAGLQARERASRATLGSRTAEGAPPSPEGVSGPVSQAAIAADKLPGPEEETGPAESDAARANAASGDGAAPQRPDGGEAPGSADRRDTASAGRGEQGDDPPPRKLACIDEAEQPLCRDAVEGTQCAAEHGVMLAATDDESLVSAFRARLAVRLNRPASWFRLASPDKVAETRELLAAEVRRLGVERAVEIAAARACDQGGVKQWFRWYLGVLQDAERSPPSAKGRQPVGKDFSKQPEW